jgi:orotidine-5'-phosphate decarboxylase
MKTEQAKLCVALDALSPEKAAELGSSLRGAVDVMKIGLGLYARGGNDIVARFVDQGFSVFLDLKLHDIPSQVGDAVGVVAGLGVSYLTIHTSGGSEMMRYAVEARDAHGGVAPVKLLGVSVLTSLSAEHLREVAVHEPVEDTVARRVTLAGACGIDGIVCSPRELSVIRSVADQHKLIRVTPGIRPKSAAVGDQQRVATPADAIADGANVLVVGRPIKNAPNPYEAAMAIRREMGIEG